MPDATRAFLSPYPARPPGLRFRAVVDADLPFLCALYASTREAELAQVSWPEEAKQAFLADQFRRQHEHYVRNYVGADFLVIERDDGNEKIGRLYVHRTPREIRLMDIALVASERGRGIGGALLAELMDEARATGAQITLHVEPNNPACRLYERLGFALIENRGVYLFLGWKPEHLL